MNGARETMLAGIRRALGGGAERARAVERRLAEHPRGPAVARTKGDAATLRALFLAKAEEAAATVAIVPSMAEVPRAIADYLRERNLPTMVRIAPDPALSALPWASVPLLTVSEGATDGSDPVALTDCVAGIAETGTLMLASGADNPTGLSFLPETHMVVLRRDQLVGGLEDAWDRLRETRGPGGSRDWPRAVNFVTGPSRSADIEQTLQMGAHGPKRLHILLVDG
jgi:L-lactate dehydrogenase complex protein LldG